LCAIDLRKKEATSMASQVVDTDGHIFEKDDIMFEYLQPPYRG